MSNLSELLPAGAGAKSAEFVASGTLSSGQVVAVTADGTVTAITADALGFSSSGGFQVSTYDVGGGLPFGVYIPGTSTIVVAFTNSSSYGSHIYTCVGTVAGDAIEFTSPVLLSNNGTTYVRELVYDPDTEQIVLLVAQGNSSSQYLKNYVGTLNNNSVTWSNLQDIYTADRVYDAHIIYDSNVQLFLAMAVNNNNDLIFVTGQAAIGSITWNTYQFFNDRARNFNLVYDATNSKVVVSYRDNDSPYNFLTKIGEFSGQNINWGNVVTVYADGSNNRYSGTQVDYDQISGKLLYSGSNTATAGLINFVGTVSGTNVTISSSTTKDGAQYRPDSGNLVYNSTTGVSTLFLSKTTALEISISGTTVTYGDSGTFTADVSGVSPVLYDSLNNKTILFYDTYSAGTYFTQGGAKFYYAPSSNNTDFIGITDQAIANTATGAVIVQGGVSEKLSGLTVGADYYVQADGSIASPTAPDPYNLSGAVYDEVSFSVSGQAATPTAMRFNDDGTKMYVADFSGTIYQYSLSEAFNIATAAYASISYSVSGQESSPRGLAFNDDGTKMFVVGSSAKAVLLYNLGSAFNISTASYSSTSFSVSAIGNPTSLAFSVDGTEMYVTDNNTTDSAHQYSLSTGWDITTASFTSSFTVSSQDGNPTGITFNSDGTQMYVAGQGTDAIYQYNLSTAYSVSSAVYSGTSLSVAAQDIDVGDVVFSSTGVKMYIVGYNTDAVYQYSLNGSTSTVPAGRALSSTSILLEG